MILNRNILLLGMVVKTVTLLNICSVLKEAHAFTVSSSTTQKFGLTGSSLSPSASTHDHTTSTRTNKLNDVPFSTVKLYMATNSNSNSNSKKNSLMKVPEDDDVPIPFVDTGTSTFIECYADSIANVGGVEYTIGSPCDHSVALCYFASDEQLVPVELDEELMNEVFPIAASIVEEEFGEELVLERTPQTLTLVGELEEGEEDDEMDDEDEEEEDDDDNDDPYDADEEVEILLTFEHDDKEFNLVRLLDPVLLVSKADNENGHKRILLTPEESDKIMPTIERLFLDYEE